MFYPRAYETFDMVLSRIYEHNGRIASFDWSENKCVFEVENCCPEEIAFDRPCAVSYEKCGSVFFISFCVADFAAEKSAHCLKTCEFHGVLRRSLALSGALISFEKLCASSCEIEFFVSGSEFKNCLFSCVKRCDENFWHEKYAAVDCLSNGCKVNVGFSPGIKTESSVLSLVCSYSSLFGLDDSFFLKMQFPALERKL